MPSAEGAVPYRRISSELAFEAAAVDIFQGEAVGRIVPGAEVIHVHILPRGYLVVDFPTFVLHMAVPYVLHLELHPFGVRLRYHVQVQAQRQQRDEHRCGYIRHHHAVVAHSARQDCDYLGVRGHPGGEENHRDEHEQRTEHVYEVRDEVDVVVEDYLMERHVLAGEVVNLFGDVEDDDDSDYEQQGHEESDQEALRDV